MTPINEIDPDELLKLLGQRRDIRGNRFTNQPVSEQDIDLLLQAACLAPSVGYSQPWEFVLIRDTDTKQQVKASFDLASSAAADQFDDDRQRQYQQLRLEGIVDADLNIAVFYTPSDQPVLGQASMPEVGEYSVVCAIQNIWLMARTLDLGLGWVSILDPEQVKKIVNAPPEHKLIGYLCIGHVDQFGDRPELETLGWAQKKPIKNCVIKERYANTANGPV
ncbi:MAG: 5,6-dimethylbenzimidazole synthase [Immundisolibacteraceae bacterium]|nr:5,6-dimethylbenzimidazole synthase [Immundisolibacteraceae bacterium]